MPHDEQRSKIQKLGGGEAGDDGMAGFGAMDVGHLAVMLREVVRGELQGLAKSAELAVIAASVSELRTSCDADRVVASSRLDAQDKELGNQKELMAALRASLEDLRAELRGPGSGGGSSSSGDSRGWPSSGGGGGGGPSLGGAAQSKGSANSGGGAGAFEPRHVYVRGWAPFGARADAKLDRTGYGIKAGELQRMLPEDMRVACQTLPGYALNHQITFKVVGGARMCYAIVDMLRLKVEEHQFLVNGKAVKVSVELSPERRQSVAAFFHSLERVEREITDKERYETCPRGLKFYEKPCWEIIGELDAKGQWRWGLSGLALVGATVLLEEATREEAWRTGGPRGAAAAAAECPVGGATVGAAEGGMAVDAAAASARAGGSWS